jgi:hypothetical protein
VRFSISEAKKRRHFRPRPWMNVGCLQGGGWWCTSAAEVGLGVGGSSERKGTCVCVASCSVNMNYFRPVHVLIVSARTKCTYQIMPTVVYLKP